MGWAEELAPPRGCSPLSGRVWAAQLEAVACGRGCDGEREWERGGAGRGHGSGSQAQGGSEGDCEGGRVGVKRGCGNEKVERGQWSQFLCHRSGCEGREKACTHQGGTTDGWEVAPRRRS